MRKLLDPIRSLVTLAIMIPVTALVAGTVTVLAAIKETSPAIERVIRQWAHLWFVLAGITLEVRGDLDQSHSYVVVSNHSSWFDIFANFIATPVPLRFLAKKELFQIPILAQAMRAVGMIEIDRDKAMSMHDSINDKAGAIAGRAQSVMVYPEGTRTRDGEIQRFKPGAFVIAIENQLPILPVTIAGSFIAFPSDSFIMRTGSKIIVQVGEPIPTTGLGRESAREMTRMTQELVTETRARLDEELAAT